MVDFIGVSRVRELLARRGTARFIEELAGEIEADFLRWESFDKSPRHATHSSVGVIELMPASDGRLYAFKYVNGHPKNTQAGLLTVTAFGVLADVETGYPRLLSELTLTTALRTAATSAVAVVMMSAPVAASAVEPQRTTRRPGRCSRARFRSSLSVAPGSVSNRRTSRMPSK